MKILSGMGMAFCFTLTLLASCQRTGAVHADIQRISGDETAPGPLKGEVTSVDIPAHRMLLRVENGMEQTVRWNDSTAINGVPAESVPPGTNATTAALMHVLAIRPGSAVVISATDDQGEKIATLIQVTDLSSVTKLRRVRKKIQFDKNS